MEVKCQLSFIIYSQNPVKKDDLIEQINGRKSLEVILEKYHWPEEQNLNKTYLKCPDQHNGRTFASNPKVEGLSLATMAGTRREKMAINTLNNSFPAPVAQG